jgi:hypothetical protein
MNRRQIPRSVMLLLLAGLVLPARPLAAQAWYYTIDEERPEQQANFCAEREEALLVAEVFRRFGPRPGYAALSQSPKCSTRVDTFTPKEVVTQVVISEGEPGEYTVSFLEVLTSRGEIEYLVTTREIRP